MIFLILISCQPEPQLTESFELKIEHFVYNPEYRTEYFLTEDAIIVNRHWPKTDTIIFAKKLKANDSLTTISKMYLSKFDKKYLKFKSLFMKNHYSNPCILDGLQLRMTLTKQDSVQKIGISNFYLPEFGLPISFINRMIPSDLRIPFDKEKLIEDLENCKDK